MEILVADSHDAEVILALQRAAYEGEAARYFEVSIPPMQETLAELQAAFATNTFLKAVDQNQNKIVGSVRAYLNDGSCYIGRLIVHPDCQHQGIGSALMKQIEEHYAQVTRFELFTGYKSEGNIRLYQKLGYVIFKSTAVNEYLTLVYMQKLSHSRPSEKLPSTKFFNG